MIAIILALLLNTYVGIVFKWFEKYNISVLQAIVANYFTCVVTGTILYGKMPFFSSELSTTTTVVALFMGLFYLLTFLAIARCTLVFGVSTTQISNKLSLIIPVIIAMIIMGERIGVIKWIGIFLAMFSVWYASAQNAKVSGASLFLPIFIFLGSGGLDSVTNYIQRFHIQSDTQQTLYIIHCFTSAFLCSSIYLLSRIIKKEEVMNWKSLLGGIILGIPNYFSIYYLIQALRGGLLPSSALIPIVNIGVVFLSTLVSVIFFKDKLSKRQYIGLGLSALAILLILLGDA